ncbi:histidine kinase, partial [Streptomyces sp. SCA2-4]|nr:histidine kinase [Streptomyces huiliensis]
SRDAAAPADPSATAAFPQLAPVPDADGAGRIVPPAGTGRFGQQDAGRRDDARNGAQESTPLFQELESHWFHGQEETRERTPEPPAAPVAPDVTAQTPLPDWRESPNDERWRRAEQVRVPAADGTTSSGLPRRVPRANLVEGTAQQQALPEGPQVSRAPDDVRGRLTNLRRGIQQGRQAGTSPASGSHHGGPTYQQER